MNDCYSRCFTIDLFEEEKGFVEFSLPGMKKGFTLIELLIAVSIIAILISIGVVSYGSVNKRSRDAKRKGDIEQLRSGLEMYRRIMGIIQIPVAEVGRMHRDSPPPSYRRIYRLFRQIEIDASVPV